MKLLIDANISFKVAPKIRKHFETVIHVSDTGLTVPAKDIEIWQFAKENSFIIVTYDEDFTEFVNIYGAPPKVIWLRFGNAPVSLIVEKILLHLSDIQQLSEDKNIELLEIY